ncbi:unnamed protein product [Rhizophagus irregularis]|nr:unnamed protein product [Rhizophagus irregularis]
MRRNAQKCIGSIFISRDNIYFLLSFDSNISNCLFILSLIFQSKQINLKNVKSIYIKVCLPFKEIGNFVGYKLMTRVKVTRPSFTHENDEYN